MLTIILAIWAAVTKLPETGWLMNYLILSPTFLEVGKFKIKAPSESMSSEGPFPGVFSL